MLLWIMDGIKWMWCFSSLKKMVKKVFSNQILSSQVMKFCLEGA